jgi:uncharacterized protein
MINLVAKIAAELNLKDFQVNNTVKLLVDEECTIPFVARYRKEMTGSLDEVVLRNIHERYEYLTELEANKVKYLKVVEEHCKGKPELQSKLPELRLKFEKAETKQELEDLYLPFKPKRRTRAQIAKEKGLEPLLEMILEKGAEIIDLEAVAKEFVSKPDDNIDPKLQVKSAEEALNGAADIYSERTAETAEIRALVREMSFESGLLVSKKIEQVAAPEETEKKGKKAEASKYENYFDYKEPVTAAASHRVMAVRRGEAEKVLKVTIEVNSEAIVTAIKQKSLETLPRLTATVKTWLEKALEDCYKRLIAPSIETEIRLKLKQDAELEAIRVFSENLENLLLLPPIPNMIVMGVDPGLRTGSKFAIVNSTGKLLDHTTLYTDLGNKETDKTVKAKAEILRLINQYSVKCVAIGNGTGSREINRLVTQVIKENKLKDVKRLVVNEAGASVYSTMDIARHEFPDLDPTIRSAVSIARRLQDPLAELVKIDPRSIGVGQYQHDVNVTKLKNSLEAVVESCVNRVGVNVNTASSALLAYVSGIGASVAKNVIAKRDETGGFLSRAELLKVAGFGPKAFEQAAGFLRVPESQNPLDNSGVHPERYDIVTQISKDLNTSLVELIGKKDVVEAISLEKYVTEQVGMPTLKDIASELVKPGRDPREDGTRLMFSDDVTEIEDLTVGMKLPGTVTNVTNFGAFVDIGVHQDGLIHISELADKFVDDPSKVVSVGDVVEVRVIDVDVKRRRIGLSRKQSTDSYNSAASQSTNKQNLSQSSKRGPLKPRQGAKRTTGGNQQRGRANQQQFTMDDLLAKFNQRK